MPMIAFLVDEETRKKLSEIADLAEGDSHIRSASGAAKLIVQMYLEFKWEG